VTVALPPVVDVFVRTLVGNLVRVAGQSMIGVYVHGSAVLGDFDPAVSDVDLLVVAVDGVDRDTLDRIVGVLREAPDCPGGGLEASVVAASAARDPGPPWPFLAHVTTGPEAAKVVFGRTMDGDDDLVLHYLAARAAGVALVGPTVDVAIGPLDTRAVLVQLANELRWAVRNASGPYAVLNACRALRFAADGRVVAKADAGEWAVAEGIAVDLTAPALDARRRGASYGITEPIAAWVLEVADGLAVGR
jgi:streptomycin 3"-adenylyltransferase